MSRRSYFVISIIILLAASAISVSAQNYVLRWADEFDGPAGTAPSAERWGYDIGGNGWGNNELETYTNRTDNAYLDGNGHLVIKLIKESFKGPDGIKRQYTSA